MKKFASISLLFSILLICILFSQYINYFTDSSQKKIIERYTAAAEDEFKRSHTQSTSANAQL